VVVVELKGDDAWGQVDPATVFKAGQEIRFRIRLSTAAYVYVLDETPLGQQNWIFPVVESSAARMQPNREYAVRADGAYRLSAQPGYDTLYWILSPVKLPFVSQLRFREHERPARKLLPRCQESVLRARGICTDAQAGTPLPAQSATVAELFRNVADTANLTRDGNVVMYEMRIAHK